MRIVPLLAVEAAWRDAVQACISTGKSSFWASLVFRVLDDQSASIDMIHFTIELSTGENGLIYKVKADDEDYSGMIKLVGLNNYSSSFVISVEVPELSDPSYIRHGTFNVRIHTPHYTISDIYEKNLLVGCLDLSPDGELALVSGNSVCKLIRLVDSALLSEFAGHKADITVAKFFPSGKVVFTGSVDTEIRIFDISGDCAATLSDHTSTVTDIATIERGWNIISSSSAGEVFLWHVGTQAVLERYMVSSIPINALSVYQPMRISANAEGRKDTELERGTSHKQIYCACDDGKLVVIDLNTGNSITRYCHCSPLSSIAIHEGTCLVGTGDGIIIEFEINAELETSCSPRNLYYLPADARISDICIAHGEKQISGFWAASTDGNIAYFPIGCEIATEHLSGPEWDPIFSLKTTLSKAVSIARDGRIPLIK